MKAQDGYARAYSAQLTGRDALAARFAEVFYYNQIDPTLPLRIWQPLQQLAAHVVAPLVCNICSIRKSTSLIDIEDP